MPDGMAAEAPIRETETRRFAIRLPRPLWVFLAALTVGAFYAGGYWHFFRSGPTYEIGGVSYSLDIERAVVHHLRAVSFGILGEAELIKFLDAALAEWNETRSKIAISG